MGLIRFLIFFLVVWLSWRIFQNYKAKQALKRKGSGKLASSRMVKCEYCAVHLPAGNAVAHEDMWFCNQQHKARFLSDQHTP